MAMMTRTSPWKKLFCLILATCSLVSVSAAKDERSDGPFAKLQAQYYDLSPKGKLAAGATVGFVGSRLALKTISSVVKVGAAAFVAAEALKMTGVMDDLPSLSDEQNDLLTKVKGTVLRQTEEFRVQIRRNLNQDSLQDFFDKEKMAAVGVAGGAIAGALL